MKRSQLLLFCTKIAMKQEVAMILNCERQWIRRGLKKGNHWRVLTIQWKKTSCLINRFLEIFYFFVNSLKCILYCDIVWHLLWGTQYKEWRSGKETQNLTPIPNPRLTPTQTLNLNPEYLVPNVNSGKIEKSWSRPHPSEYFSKSSVSHKIFQSAW